jgi:outer membrane protein
MNLRKSVLVLLTGLLALSVSVGAAAEMKIGFVNTERIFRDAAPAVRAQKKLEKEFEKRDQELQRMAKQLQSMQESLEKNSMTMSETDRRNKEREFNDLNRDFQRKQREFREDLNQRRNEELALVLERANKAIKAIAEAEKYDIIFQEAVYANPRIDITDKVIKALADTPAK